MHDIEQPREFEIESDETIQPLEKTPEIPIPLEKLNKTKEILDRAFTCFISSRDLTDRTDKILSKLAACLQKKTMLKNQKTWEDVNKFLQDSKDNILLLRPYLCEYCQRKDDYDILLKVLKDGNLRIRARDRDPDSDLEDIARGLHEDFGDLYDKVSGLITESRQITKKNLEAMGILIVEIKSLIGSTAGKTRKRVDQKAEVDEMRLAEETKERTVSQS